jgi:hypothetical protein
MVPRVGAGMPVKSVVSSVSSNENEKMAPGVGDRDGWSINTRTVWLYSGTDP